MANHEDIVAEVRAGIEVAESRLVDLLCADSRTRRFTACRDLAWAFLSTGRSERALQLARRAFGLWDGEPGFIDKYIELLRSERDTEGVRVASKRAGMLSARENDVMRALLYFNMHHYAYQSTGQGDRYDYDHDILKEIERLAGAGDGRLQAGSAVSREKIRVAYLVFGANHVSSALVRIMHDFARYHDKNKFEVLFFSPDMDNSFVQENVGSLLSVGGKLVIAGSTDDWLCLQRTKAAIRNYAPDILVSVAALADYRQYYLYIGCPAVVRVSLSYGPPAQFVPLVADWAISATRHPHMDNPCDSSVIQLETTLPVLPQGTTVLPEGVCIPEGAVVIMAAGRSEKFLNQRYWEALLKVLDNHPNAYMIVIGIIQRPSFLDGLLETAAGRRIQVLGWLENYHALLAQADVVVDTYPSGGGLTITDSMAFGIPVLSFANDYLIPYNQTNWNPAEEIIGTPELIVPRGDFNEFARRLDRLVTDQELRQRLGAECRNHILNTRGNPQRMVRRVESEYIRLWDRAYQRDGAECNEPLMSRWLRSLKQHIFHS